MRGGGYAKAMPRDRDLLVNFERMRREMDELFGDVWGEGWWPARTASGFKPRVDVYYCSDETPKAIIKAELPGVRMERPVQETEGRVYQQVEIEAGPFRRVVELNADVVAEEARATYEDGVLRVALPLRSSGRASRHVPIETKE